MNIQSTLDLTLENDRDLYGSRYCLADAQTIAERLYKEHHLADNLNIVERRLCLLDVLYRWTEDDLSTLRNK